MTTVEILALVVTLVGVVSFAAVITVLYKSYANSQIDEIASGRRDAEIVNDVIHENLEETKKHRKIMGIVKNVSFGVIMAIIIPLFTLSLISKINGNVLMVGNNTMMVVASGSMSEKNPKNKFISEHPELNNQFKTFDIININKVKNESDLQVADVIAYKNDKGVNIIHRITSIVEVNGEKHFVTQGDANSGEDAYRCTFKDVNGRYTGKRVPTIGIFIMFFQSYSGIITILSVVYCLIMVDKISGKIEKATENRIEILSKKVDYRKLIQQEMGIDDNAKVEFVEKLYYHDAVYTFEEDNSIVEETKEKNEDK